MKAPKQFIISERKNIIVFYFFLVTTKFQLTVKSNIARYENRTPLLIASLLIHINPLTTPGIMGWTQRVPLPPLPLLSGGVLAEKSKVRMFSHD